MTEALLSIAKSAAHATSPASEHMMILSHICSILTCPKIPSTIHLHLLHILGHAGLQDMQACMPQGLQMHVCMCVVQDGCSTSRSLLRSLWTVCVT